MSKQARSDTTFGSIEGAAEYLGLLLESVNEARVDLEAETALSSSPGMERRRPIKSSTCVSRRGVTGIESPMPGDPHPARPSAESDLPARGRRELWAHEKI